MGMVVLGKASGAGIHPQDVGVPVCLEEERLGKLATLDPLEVGGFCREMPVEKALSSLRVDSGLYGRHGPQPRG
jgi:hypothetical protein